MQLTKPLVVFDIEATGISARSDRIVELAILKIMPDDRREMHTFRINPGIPIPPETTAIHGISDEDVADCPRFEEIAGKLLKLLEDCDLCGYNVLRFDIPMLTEEFARARITFKQTGRRVIDAQRIYHRREPRDLAAALSFFCDKEHVDAHGAEADVRATYEVLEGQLDKYPDLPHNVEELDAYCNPTDPSWADRNGRLRWSNGEVVINFGRKKGMNLKQLVRDDKNFLKWILKSDFPEDTRLIVQDALKGVFPEPR